MLKEMYMRELLCRVFHMDTLSDDTVVLLLAVFIVGASIELAYGSIYIGLGFLMVSVAILIHLIQRNKDRKIEKIEYTRSPLLIVAGIAIIAADIVFNRITSSEIQTFDTMVILFGASLTVYGLGNKLSEIGRFSTYFSLIFISLFLVLFILPMKVSMYLPYLYGHYAVAVPVVKLLKILGIGVRIADFRLIEILGPNHAYLKIDLACFGWYSLLLVTSMVLAYTVTMKNNPWPWMKTLKIIAVLGIVSYIANLLRVAALVASTYYYGVNMMLAIHPHLGWILFVIVLIPAAGILLRKTE